MRNMKVCLVALVILVCNQVTAENERTTNVRQAKQLSLSDPEQKYDLELSFPVRILDSDEATNDDSEEHSDLDDESLENNRQKRSAGDGTEPEKDLYEHLHGFHTGGSNSSPGSLAVCMRHRGMAKCGVSA